MDIKHNRISIKRNRISIEHDEPKSNAISQSNAIESQPNQSNNYLEFGHSIEIRLRSTIEFQPFDRVRLRSIGSIAEPVRLTSSGYV